MIRSTATCIAVLLFFGSWMIAQEPQGASKAPTAAFPADVIPAQQLIAWSWMQQPQPTPQQAPAPDRTRPERRTDPSDPSATQPPVNQHVTGQSAKAGNP